MTPRGVPAAQRQRPVWRGSREWQKLCAELKLQKPWICVICIAHDKQREWAIPHNATLNHPEAWSAHHLWPAADYPHLAMSKQWIAPAHRNCNTRQSNKLLPTDHADAVLILTGYTLPNPTPPDPGHSRLW